RRGAAPVIRPSGVPMDIGPTELIIVLLIVLLLFGGAKLPKLARSMGQASKEFRDGIKVGADDEAKPEAA
ncbi:MAG: twin-arginine translocase TatA/TatE family subunit, partial [Actinomycetes bacterium]